MSEVVTGGIGWSPDFGSVRPMKMPKMPEVHRTKALWRVFVIETPMFGTSYVMSDREMTQAEVYEFMRMGSIDISHKAVSDFSYSSNLIKECYSTSKKADAKRILADLVAGKNVFSEMFSEGEA